MALLRATRALDNLTFANDDQRVGIEIVRRAVEAPVRQIAEKPKKLHFPQALAWTSNAMKTKEARL